MSFFLGENHWKGVASIHHGTRCSFVGCFHARGWEIRVRITPCPRVPNSALRILGVSWHRRDLSVEEEAGYANIMVEKR